MIRFFPGAEMHSEYFRGVVDISLMHARRFVADVSARTTISLIYHDSNDPGGADVMLFAELVEWGIIPIVCRCRLCRIQAEERPIKGYPLFLSHLLVDVHPILTDWVHVPREEVKVVDFSRILKVAQEVVEVLGFNQNDAAIVNLRLACRCGHPSYHGPLTFGQLVRDALNAGFFPPHSFFSRTLDYPHLH